MSISPRAERAITLHQVKIFEAVARHLNTTKGAQELRISQPSISQQLKLLEQDLNKKLYLKTGREIEVTEAGRILLNSANMILMELEEVTKTFHSGVPIVENICRWWNLRSIHSYRRSWRFSKRAIQRFRSPFGFRRGHSTFRYDETFVAGQARPIPKVTETKTLNAPFSPNAWKETPGLFFPLFT